MRLHSLHIKQFKNYSSAAFNFRDRIVAITGPNGIGKTNLLDAVHYLCMTKSYFSTYDKRVVRHGDNFFRLEGRFEEGDEITEVAVVYQKNKGKTVTVDGKNMDRFSDHIGSIPVVVVAPDDQEFINGGSRGRRKWLDAAISQQHSGYLKFLMKYRKLLKQRNALLKEAAEKGSLDEDLLDFYDQNIVEPARTIHQYRASFIEDFNTLFKPYYGEISGDREVATCSYQSALTDQGMEDILRDNRKKDRIMERTTMGIHRDDIIFKLDGESLKEYGSQGQKKSYLLALKIAQGILLFNKIDKRPIFLLDDIFDKLDEHRMRRMNDLLTGPQFGQIFLTDTGTNRVDHLLRLTGASYKIISLTPSRMKSMGRHHEEE